MAHPKNASQDLLSSTKSSLEIECYICTWVHQHPHHLSQTTSKKTTLKNPKQSNRGLSAINHNYNYPLTQLTDTQPYLPSRWRNLPFHLLRLLLPAFLLFASSDTTVQKMLLKFQFKCRQIPTQTIWGRVVKPKMKRRHFWEELWTLTWTAGDSDSRS
jgi:hypothetical protein